MLLIFLVSFSSMWCVCIGLWISCVSMICLSCVIFGWRRMVRLLILMVCLWLVRRSCVSLMRRLFMSFLRKVCLVGFMFICCCWLILIVYCCV